VTGAHLTVLALIALIVLVNMIAPGGKVHERSLRYVLLLPGMIMACSLFVFQLRDIRGGLLSLIIAGVLCLCVTGQMVGFWLYKSKNFFGFYGDQPHHLGLFASLILPLLGWSIFRLAGWMRVALLPWAMASLFLLWQSGSRISWLVFFSSAMFSSLLFLNPKQFLEIFLCMIALSALTAWLSGVSVIGARIQDLITTFRTEERMSIWPDTVAALKLNSPGEWLFGHGIGSYRSDFQYASPHNAALQLVFENGILGMLLVVGGFGSLMWALLRSSHRLSHSEDRYLALTLFSLLCIEAGQCLLTKSIYSKYILFTLSLIVGASLVVIEKARVEFACKQEPADPATGLSGGHIQD
jgi:O-antigen ligase